MFPGSSRRGYQRGRGRGGRFSSRGRGAGVSKKWVRPSTREAHDLLTETADNSKQEAVATTVNDGDSSKQPAKLDSSVAAAKPTVILKGPKRHPKAPPKSHTWKRPGDESKSHSGDDKTAEHVASVAATPNDSQAPAVHDNDLKTEATKPSKPATHPAPMVRRGRHKLISKDPTETLLDETVPVAKSAGRRDRATAANTETTKDSGGTSTLPMKKRGRNKLVLAKPNEEAKQDVEKQSLSQHAASLGEDKDTSATHKKNHSNEMTLARKGNNKLVLQDAKATDYMKGKSDSHFTERSQFGRGRGSGRRFASAGHGVKRIKLNPAEQHVVAPVDEDDQAESDNETEEPSKAPAVEKYTEFAYRQSSQRGRGRGRGARGRGGAARGRGRNMGLVRVEPDAATTRMCPTYLRGEPCTNPKCTRRHDVPKEAAIPICSFFQRNGMCNKGDACQFRHIKVNAHATVCPSFSLLGFCENKDCTMKHVRTQKKKHGGV